MHWNTMKIVLIQPYYCFIAKEANEMVCKLRTQPSYCN